MKKRRFFGMAYKRMPPNKLIGYLVKTFQLSLDETEARLAFNRDDDFLLGEKTAMIECLEIIQQYWKHAKKFGLNYDIEKKYPI